MSTSNLGLSPLSAGFTPLSEAEPIEPADPTSGRTRRPRGNVVEARPYHRPDGEEVRNLKTRLIDMRERAKTSESKVVQLEQEVLSLKKEHSATESKMRIKVDRLENLVIELDSSSKRKDAEVSQLTKSSEILKKTQEKLGLELKDASSHSNRPDSHPLSVLLTMLAVVNSDIVNTAMEIVELYETAKKSDIGEFRSNVNFFDECKALTKETIGPQLYSSICQVGGTLIFQDPTTPDDPLPLQLALQKILGQWCKDTLMIFKRIPGDRGAILREVYQNIRNKGRVNFSRTLVQSA